MKRLSPSEAHQLHPATPLWLALALLRLQLREGARQLELRVKERA